MNPANSLTLTCRSCGRTFIAGGLAANAAHRCKCGYFGYFSRGKPDAVLDKKAAIR